MMRKLLFAVALVQALAGAALAQMSLPFPGPGGVGIPAAVKVALDATGTVNGYVASASSISFSNLTVGSGSNRALVVTLVQSTAPTSPTCTWDSGGTNQTMTLVSQASNTRNVVQFGLLAPTSGNKTLSCSWTGTPADTFVDAISFINVDQTNVVSTFYNATAATGASSSPGVTVAASATDAAVDAAGAINVTSTPTQTQLFRDNTHGSVINGGASYNINTASVSFSWSGSAPLWADLGVAVRSVSAPPTTIYNTAITGNSGGNVGLSLRAVTTTSGAGGARVSVLAGCSSSGSCTAGHVGICVQSTTYNCTAAPVEVTFGGGGHGYSLGVSATLRSDWVPLTFPAGATLIVIVDSTSSNQGDNASACGTTYFQSTTSYNVQNPTGTWTPFTACSLGFSVIQASN